MAESEQIAMEQLEDADDTRLPLFIESEAQQFQLGQNYEQFDPVAIPGVTRPWQIAKVVLGTVSITVSIIIFGIAGALLAQYPGDENEPIDFIFPAVTVRPIAHIKHDILSSSNNNPHT